MSGVPADRPGRSGAWLIALSAALFGLLGGVVKHLSQSLSPDMIVFFRNAAGLAVLLPFIPRLDAGVLTTRYFHRHLVRDGAGLAAMYLSFYSIGRLRLADAYVLAYTAPLFMPMIAKVWLGEPVPAHSARVVVLGFVGVLLVLKPGVGLFQPMALAALASGFLAAVAQVGIRRLTETESSTAIVFYFALISTVVSGLPLLRTWTTPAPNLWVWLFALGGIASLAQWLMTEGYRRSAPGRVGPLMYVAVAVAGVLDWLIWRRWPDALAVAGIALIVLAGAVIIHQSARAVPGLEEPTVA